MLGHDHLNTQQQEAEDERDKKIYTDMNTSGICSE
jgi:hypothetical protein